MIRNEVKLYWRERAEYMHIHCTRASAHDDRDAYGSELSSRMSELEQRAHIEV